MWLSSRQDSFVRDLMKETEIAAPCLAKWSEMIGDEKVRFCGDYKLHVYYWARRMQQYQDQMSKPFTTSSGLSPEGPTSHYKAPEPVDVLRTQK